MNDKSYRLRRRKAFYTKVYGGLMCLSVSFLFLYIAYWEHQEGVEYSESVRAIVGYVIAIALGAIVGCGLIIAAFSRNFGTRFYSEFEAEPPVIECKNCYYDLRGSVLEGSNQCPECGAQIPKEQIDQIKRLDQMLKAKD